MSKVFVCAGMGLASNENINIQARELGKILAQNKSITYVQGGSDKGLMGETLKEFCVRNGLYNSKYYIDCYAFVDANDEWNSKGDMGWFGISSNEKENIEWTKEVSGFIENLNNDDYVIFVDCHI